MTNADKTPDIRASEIVHGLLSGGMDYSLDISLDVFNRVYRELKRLRGDVQVCIVVIKGLVACQFSDVSGVVFSVSSDTKISSATFSFIDNCVFLEAAKKHDHILKALKAVKDCWEDG